MYYNNIIKYNIIMYVIIIYTAACWPVESHVELYYRPTCMQRNDSTFQSVVNPSLLESIDPSIYTDI